MSTSKLFPKDKNFWQAANPRDARSRLVDALRLELLGPETPNEVLPESPIARYTTGQLAPFGTQTEDSDHDEAGEATGREESGAADEAVPMSQTVTIASIGLSFLVPPKVRELTVAASWGTYAPIDAEPESSDAPSPDSTDETDASASGAPKRPRRPWARTSCEPPPITALGGHDEVGPPRPRAPHWRAERDNEPARSPSD